MNNKDFEKIYLQQIIKEDYQHSLIHSLISGTSKAISATGSGIKSIGSKTVSGTKNFFKKRKTLKNIKQTINNIKNIWNPLDPSRTYYSAVDIQDFLDAKSQINFTIAASESFIPSKLKGFLQIFTNCGNKVNQLIADDPELLTNPVTSIKIQPMIKQYIQNAVQGFKQSSSLTAQEKLENIYMNIVLQQSTSLSSIQTELKNQASILGFFNSGSDFEKHFGYSEVLNLLSAYLMPGKQLYPFKNIIQNDEIDIKLTISQNKVNITVKSDMITVPNKVIKICNSKSQLYNNLILAVKQIYSNQLTKGSKKSILKKNLNNIKYKNYEKIFNAAQTVILNLKWTGWFGSLKSVLKAAAECSINMDDIKFLVILYFHIAVIK